MTKAQEFSISVQSEDPVKKEKPGDKVPDVSNPEKPSKKKDKKDDGEGEELVRVQSQRSAKLTELFCSRKKTNN